VKPAESGELLDCQEAARNREIRSVYLAEFRRKPVTPYINVLLRCSAQSEI